MMIGILYKSLNVIILTSKQWRRYINSESNWKKLLNSIKFTLNYLCLTEEWKILFHCRYTFFRFETYTHLSFNSFCYFSFADFPPFFPVREIEIESVRVAEKEIVLKVSVCVFLCVWVSVIYVCIHTSSHKSNQVCLISQHWRVPKLVCLLLHSPGNCWLYQIGQK